MSGTITSKSNPRIKLYRSLKTRKGRQATGLCLVEGIRPVGEAVQSGSDVEAVLYAPDLLRSDFAMQIIARCEQGGVPSLAVSTEVFNSLADKDNPQGLCAVVKMKWQPLSSLDRENFPWGIALVAPQDPGNIGTILRSVDAVGASGLILIDTEQEHSAEAYHPSAIRASMGSIFWIPLVHTTFSDFVAWKEAQDCQLVGSSARGSMDSSALRDVRKPCVLLLGSERQGLTDSQVAACSMVVRLPMRGRVTSLNLSVAAGILMYAMRPYLVEEST